MESIYKKVNEGGPYDERERVSYLHKKLVPEPVIIMVEWEKYSIP